MALGANGVLYFGANSYSQSYVREEMGRWEGFARALVACIHAVCRGLPSLQPVVTCVGATRRYVGLNTSTGDSVLYFGSGHPGVSTPLLGEYYGQKGSATLPLHACLHPFLLPRRCP
jgi:hypothetical protein